MTIKDMPRKSIRNSHIEVLSELLRNDPSGKLARVMWQQIYEDTRYSAFLANELWRLAEERAYPIITEKKHG